MAINMENCRMNTMTRHFTMILVMMTTVLLFAAQSYAGKDDLRLEVLPLPAASRASLTDNTSRAYITADPNWYTWCPSVIRGDDGKYHMFHSRWARKTTFSGWLLLSEVAHAVAVRPEGPYSLR